MAAGCSIVLQSDYATAVPWEEPEHGDAALAKSSSMGGLIRNYMCGS